MRIILVGSAGWCDPHQIMDFLEDMRTGMGLAPEQITIVNRGCPGADRMAVALAHRCGFQTEIWDRDMHHLGRYASVEQMVSMVEAGADACLVFDDDFDIELRRGYPSSIAYLARRRGIPVEARDAKGMPYFIPDHLDDDWREGISSRA